MTASTADNSEEQKTVKVSPKCDVGLLFFVCVCVFIHRAFCFLSSCFFFIFGLIFFVLRRSGRTQTAPENEKLRRFFGLDVVM